MSDEILKGFAQAETKMQEIQQDIDQEITKGKKGGKPKSERRVIDTSAEETKGATDDVYRKRPQQQNYRTNQRGRGNYQENYDQNREGRGRGYRGRGNYASRGFQRSNDESGDQVDGEGFQRNKSYRGKRGGGWYKDSEQDGDGEERENYRGRGRGRGGETRGRGRGGYKDRDYRTEKQKKNEVEQSDSDGSDTDELSSEQQAFISKKKTELAEKLKGIVTVDQIAVACINKKFNEIEVQKWVRQLTDTDKRVEGCKDFEWNDTVTAGEKRANRAKKIYDAKNKKQIAEEKKRKHEEWLQRQEEKKKRQEEWEARKAERDAKKEEKRKAAEAKKAEAASTAAAAVEEAGENNEDQETKTPDGKQFTVKSTGGQKLVYQPKKKSSDVETPKPNEAPAEEDDYDEDDNEEGYDDEYEDEEDLEPEVDPAVVDDDDRRDQHFKDSERAESELLHEVATQQQREHEERVQREKEEQQAAEQKRAQAKNKEEEERAKKAQDSKKEEAAAAANPLAAMMMPGMLPNPLKPGDAKDGPMPAQAPTVLSAYDAYNYMMFHQQMAQHYQSMFTQQMALQQQMLNNSGGNADQTAAGTQQFMQQQPLGFPMAAGLPTAGLSGLMQPTNGQGAADQQQLGMMPGYMPMMFPMNQGAPGLGGNMQFAPMQFPNQQNQGQSSGKDDAQ